MDTLDNQVPMDCDNYLASSPAKFIEPVTEWLAKFEAKTFTEDEIRKHWSKEVPRLFSPKRGCHCLNTNFDEESARISLFLTLEQFITNSPDPVKVFESLKNLDNKPMLCGKVFKNNEPTYCCRDCGLDQTCVLCVDCFKRSAHRNHKYKMHMSSGAGYCDCGDVEAWKSDAFCDSHIKGFNEHQDGNSIDARERLPIDLVQRAEEVIRTVSHYCFELLDWEHATSLPKSLRPENEVDANSEDYVTMLFNDEIHTYEQVIQTLSRAIECTQKEAIDFATTIDHEGRSIVKCSVLQTCLTVKYLIEKITSRHGGKPLKCVVMLTSIIAFQTYAMRLLSWLQKILSYCEGFRSIFSSIMMQPSNTSENIPLLESVMKADVRLWKTARNQWHQLFISGLLMDPESKKAFAKVFTRIYPSLMKDFINDDHEHSISITCLAVQIFTVPTLARALIAEVDAFYILTEAFLKKCEKHINQQGKLAFERNHATITIFRRAQFILSDIKYLLSIKPTEWNDDLRKNFFHGFCTLITLLQWIQGMDSVVRQIGQHVEFEAEWETGINLQLKLAPVLSLVIEWCGSDRLVLLKTLKYALQEVIEKTEPMKFGNRVLRDIVCKCIDYDVSTLPVTVHLPFHRLVSGLLLNLTFYDIDYYSSKFLACEQPCPIELMELPLRTLVMIAQFRAGMWRRNGYSLANQIYFYHNVRLRDEMYDRDIIMLQYVASLIDPNEFIFHLLNKFGVLIWAQQCYENTSFKREEDHMRQTIILVEEFLGLLLTILSERYVPGIGKVTFEEKIKREIIQYLCMEPMTHSDLLKCLPREISEDIVIENLVMEVANFKRPAPNQAGGKYELKEEYYNHFNLFFYHYTRQEHIRAEEVQIKRKKANKEKLICCPPPIPPDFTPHFSSLCQILQCDLFLHIVKLVLEKTSNVHTIFFSETQFEKVLHLIGLALHEEVKFLSLSPSETNKFIFSELAAKHGIQKLCENCLQCDRIGTHQDLLKWTLQKFSEVALMRGQNKNENMDTSLLMTSEKPDQNFVEKKDKKSTELAAQRRAKIMAQMKDMQKKFIKGNSEYFKPLEETKPSSSSKSNLFSQEISKVNTSVDRNSPIAVGSLQRGKHFETESHICILCREEQELTPTGLCMVFAAFVQRSTVLSKNRDRNATTAEDSTEAFLMPSDLYFGTHVSTCGHVMHSECWQNFFESVLAKERRRPVRYGRHVNFDVDKSEFLCPFCECLSNAVIPLIPNCLYQSVESSGEFSEISLTDWLSAQHDAVEKVQPVWVKDPSMSMETGERYICRFKPNSLPYVLSKLNASARDAYENNVQTLNRISLASQKPSIAICEMMKLLSQSIYTISLNVNPNPEDDRVLFLSYWACAYTIHSIERTLRDEHKPIFGDLSSRRYHCLQALVRYVCVSSIKYNISIIRSHCIRLLRYLLIFDNYISSPSCLDVDAFGLLVSLIFSSPSLYLNEDKDDKFSALLVPSGNIFDQHYINLIIVFHIIQIILTNSASKTFDSTGDDLCSENDNESELQFVHEFYTGVLVAAGVELPGKLNSKNNSCKNFQKAEAEKILRLFKNELLPFLRCTALFFHFLTGVTPPTRLKEGENSDSPPLPEEEYHLLCKYLSLSSKFSILIGSTSFHHLARFWSQHPRVRILLSVDSEDLLSPLSLPLKLIIQPHSVNHLIDLPKDYSELINRVSRFACLNSDGDHARSPTMCLVCGVILCSQSYCCQRELDQDTVGACTYHAFKCGSGVGIFLRIRDCKVVLLAGRSKGCYMPPPYIDEYGETDQGLIRGNPLQLCESSYKELHRLWLRHGIPEQIAHALVLSNNLATINWQLF